MIVFLKKVRVKTIFSIFDPIRVEPLELCYLEAVLKSMNIESYIIDDMFELKPPNGVEPDAVVLQGYNVAEQQIIREAMDYKERFPGVKIIVGGVHVQLNAEAFHSPYIDYAIHSQSLEVFKQIIAHIAGINDRLPEEGADCFIDGQWKLGSRHHINKSDSYRASRNLFEKINRKTYYLDKMQVALIKGSIGCPYGCDYCYCKCINNGVYVKADYSSMLEDMKGIEAEYFWIVDDVLFVTRQDAMNFIQTANSMNIKVKIIGYLRADFILKEADLLPELKKAGLSEVIVGFESTSNRELQEYEKTTDALDYPKVISLLKENSIDLTALFMVHPDYTFRDFTQLRRFIKEENIEVYTISIFTPIKGTSSYKKLEKGLTTHDPKRYDLLHLVLKPKLPGTVFYILFYAAHLQLLKSKRIWRYIRQILKIDR